MQYKAKYKDLNIHIPQEKRKDINEKILYMIDNDLVEKSGMNKEIIFNTYTGDGGTFEINFNDYNSFYEYSKEKKNLENGQFFTQQEESKKLIELLQVKENETVLDLTCGSGSLFNYLPNLNNAYGNEIDIKSYKVCNYLYGEKITLTNGDMRNYNSNMIFDLIIGNPPFNIRMKYQGQEKNSQMIYIMKANELLKKGGILGIITPASFLNDEFSDKSGIDYMTDNFNFIGQFEINQGAFNRVGVSDNFKIKMMFFIKKSEFLEEKKYINEFTTEKKIKDDIEKIRLIKEKNKNSIKLENLKNYTNKDKEFEKKITKLLFDIRRTKATNKYYNECFNCYQLYYNQKQPQSISNEEWEKIKLTKKKVIAKLKNVLSNQHGKKIIKNENKQKVLNRKLRAVAKQSIPFEDMKIDKKIDKWLSEKSLYNEVEGLKTKLNDLQRYDMNKTIQKNFAFLQWEMGGGKSYSSLYYGLYRMEKNQCKNIFVVAPAIAIKNTYVDMMENFNLPYRVINCKSDIEKIIPGEFILLTFNMLIKNERWVKRFFRLHGKKFTLILDESDSISNINSKRCRSVLNCFKTNTIYKLLLSGTSVRNSINEVYSQLELLYNNSLNMVCKNEFIYEEDKEQKNIKKKNNDLVNKPYPPYRK
ncbi:MAG: N-6 DNA methylase, partial [Clostridia bacterium]